MAMINKIELEDLSGNKVEFKLNDCEAMALSEAKKKVVDAWGESSLDVRCNDGSEVGFEQALTTLTAIETKIAREKNIETNVEEAIDVIQGPGAWKEEVVWFEGHYNGGDTLQSWRLDHAQNGAAKNLSTASLTRKTAPYALLGKMISYTKSELEQAYASGIWNVIEEKSEARKREFDLRFGQWAFQGSGDGQFEGLLNISGVTSDTDTSITKQFSAMTDNEFQTALSTIFSTAYVETGLTAKPNTFLMPSLDAVKCAGIYSSVGTGFTSGINRLARIEDALRNMSGDSSAKVVKCNFANSSLNGGFDQYVLYKKDRFELHIENPVPFGVYPGVSIDGWNFQNTAVAQVSGVIAKYKKQLRYFKVTA